MKQEKRGYKVLLSCASCPYLLLQLNIPWLSVCWFPSWYWFAHSGQPQFSHFKTISYSSLIFLKYAVISDVSLKYFWRWKVVLPWWGGTTLTFRCQEGCHTQQVLWMALAEHENASCLQEDVPGRCSAFLCRWKGNFNERSLVILTYTNWNGNILFHSRDVAHCSCSVYIDSLCMDEAKVATNCCFTTQRLTNLMIKIIL